MEDKKTSEEWYPIYREYYRVNKKQNIIIYDPDGWDRKNYQFSWYEELITYEEFERRALECTVLMEFIKEDENKDKK